MKSQKTMAASKPKPAQRPRLAEKKPPAEQIQLAPSSRRAEPEKPLPVNVSGHKVTRVPNPYWRPGLRDLFSEDPYDASS